MKIIKLVSVIFFFATIPLLGYSVNLDNDQIFRLAVVILCGALATYSFAEAQSSATLAGNRLRLLGFRALGIFCMAVAVASLYEIYAAYGAGT